MDADDDNELTVEEFMEIRMGGGEGRNPQRQKMRQEQKKARFAPMDTDKSGKVSKVEFMEAGKKDFEAADGNKDGKVTPWEFRAHRHSH
jgi:Ca2+-binding EF-hand superfamily protein